MPGHSQLQQTHCSAPPSHGCNAAGKRQKRLQRDKKRTKRVRHSRGNTLARGGGRGGGAPGTPADISHPTARGGPRFRADTCFLKELWPMDSPSWSRYFSCRMAAHGESPHLSREKVGEG